MASPPRPPFATVPTSSSQWRFHSISTPTEWIEHYRPGGLHPVHIGDQFNDSRYRVLRKLGYGAYSTVWLAKDQLRGSFVALKILTASASSQAQELVILRRISQNPVHHRGRQTVITLLDDFEHHGPNGTHVCLIFKVMGPSAATMMDLLPENQPKRLGRRNRYSKWMAWSLLRQALLGLDFLHQAEIVHSDFQPGNLLFSVSGMDTADEARLLQGTGPEDVSEPVRRLDGKPDIWAPRYLALNQPVTEFVETSPKFTINISDLGGAFFSSSPPESIITPAGLRAPELILGGQVSTSQDVWSFGCLIFEFLTGIPLFIAESAGEDDPEANDDHVLQLSNILGPIPPFLLSQWPRANIYFNAEGKQIKHYVGDYPEGEDSDPDNFHAEFPSLEEYFDKEKPADITPTEANEIKALLRWILQYDAELRPSAAEILAHSWFSNSKHHSFNPTLG